MIDPARPAPAFQQDARHLAAVEQHIIGPFQRESLRQNRSAATQRITQRKRGDEAAQRGL
jgi:hypothetical protein